MKGEKKIALQQTKQKHNRLFNEKSPYLLQHAYNPVDWHPWGEEAFEKARRENKPIFLSIGYSTCHWCHVMEHESFEDSDVARLMNEAFISIKVDREERPDIDSLYMSVCQMMTEHCGWPLNIIMTPDKKPFFATSYIPKRNRFGRLGMLELVPNIMDVWSSRRGDVENNANEITDALKKAAQEAPGAELGESALTLAYKQLLNRFDANHGGFGKTPKFPSPHNLLFLLRYWKRYSDEKALLMVEKTLVAMRQGGIYDHIGFGLHRYSTDERWLVPHFEKMLYDQAMAAIAFVEAYQAAGKMEYKKTAMEIFEYVLRDMTSKKGGFYTAEDADSEGEEGKFYEWSNDEIQKILGSSDAELAGKVFNVAKEGNFVSEATGLRTGENILHLSKSMHDLALELNMSEDDLNKRLDVVRIKLFTHREKLIHPLKDDKVLTDWNGLMIAALAIGSGAFDEPKYSKAAADAVQFIITNMVAGDGGLLHRYRDGEAAVIAHLDDYVFLVWGLIEMYEATFDISYLKKAIELQTYTIDHFWDSERGGFFTTADNSEELLVRQKEIYDGAIPSGNSVAMLNLLRLGRLTVNTGFEEKAATIGRAFSAKVNASPSAYTQLISAVDFAMGPSYEVVIVGDANSEDTKEMLKTLGRAYIPNKVVLHRPTDQESSEIAELAEYAIYHKSIGGKATAYVCLNYQCNMPTTEVDEMLTMLKMK
ncbi:MAG: thioredoxin domain-containing protein [Proteobacteria bacterium]|nr:thioredoxin domain-containing protein [Pseudomonadota bacterium]